MTPNPTTLAEVFELAELYRPSWSQMRQEARRSGLVCEGEEEKDAEAKKAEADEAAKAPEKEAADKAAAEEAAKKKTEEGDAGAKSALDKERVARKAAEKEAKESAKKLKALEDKDLSETEKLKKENEEAKGLVTSATEKLRKANLLGALGDKGLTGAKAKAAARLLDGVEFDDDDEPTNLDDRIKAASEEFGEEMFKGVTPKKKPPKTGGGEGDKEGETPNLTADELVYAKEFGMTPEEYAEFKKTKPTLPAKKT